MLRDMLGNELQEGDMVMMVLPNSNAMGSITQIKTGGIIAGRNGKGVQPGLVTTICRFDTPFDPTSAILGNMVKVYNPTAAAESEAQRKIVTM